jgi:hypothetical protein
VERMELFCDDLIPLEKNKKVEEFSKLLLELEKNI